MVRILHENDEFLTKQIITYIGNKRLLVGEIEKIILWVKGMLGKDRLVVADMFSGSGIVARMLKQHSSLLIANDIENYSCLINKCYLSNKSEYPTMLCEEARQQIIAECERHKISGIITQNYAPKDDENIKAGERAFYTHENALIIDTYRNLIDEYLGEENKRFLLAPLITEASIHTNTSGVFKGFHKNRAGLGCFGGEGKNALQRIMGKVELPLPIFSNYDCDVVIQQEDAGTLCKKLPVLDIAYLDPPYNQHPYGSNYFMLNLIIKNTINSPVSKVSGIPNDWNRSDFNKRRLALPTLEKIVRELDAKYVVISYNCEGFISFSDMQQMLKKYGNVGVRAIKYNTFRGCRNLASRDIHTKEYLFILEKQ